MIAAPEPVKLSRRDAAEVMCAKLLACAARILASEGISGLTARRLSAAAGASTKVVYSHFGGMPGIVAALYDQGFTILTKQLEAAVASATPGNGAITAIANAYRAFARGNADLFDLMYGPTIAILLPTADTRLTASAALDVLVQAFSDCDAPDATDQARALWAAIHGVVTLERAGWFGSDEAEHRLEEASARFLSNSR
jgi:AcrR family transcriptional regulator